MFPVCRAAQNLTTRLCHRGFTDVRSSPRYAQMGTPMIGVLLRVTHKCYALGAPMFLFPPRA